MRDSDTYMAILEEGRVLQAKDDILRLGTKKFGPPSDPITARGEVLSDIDHLERIRDRMLEACTWEALLNTG
jgi:hypothetical protein